MSELNVKVGLIGKLDMLKFKNMSKVREKAIQAAPAAEISGDFAVNEKAAALHPDYLKLTIDSIISRNSAKTYVLKSVDGKALPYFRAGQYISLKLPIDGSLVTRSYSLCSSPREALSGIYAITVRSNPGGFVADRLLSEKRSGTLLLLPLRRDSSTMKTCAMRNMLSVWRVVLESHRSSPWHEPYSMGLRTLR